MKDVLLAADLDRRPMPNASTRRVARKLRQAGTSISHMTVARWRNHVRWMASSNTPEVAIAFLDDAVPKLTADLDGIAADQKYDWCRCCDPCPYSKLRKPKKSWSFSGILSFE
jgi:hypothetical protein